MSPRSSPSSILHPHPTLPYEVWATVFRFATSISGTLSTDADIFDHQRLQSRIHQSYVVKSTLRLVCRQWNEIATPLFWKYICLHDQPTSCGFQWSLSQFAKRLQSKDKEEETQLNDERKDKAVEARSSSVEKVVVKSSFRGRWVRRIDATISTRAGCLDLATIIQHCPGILVFHFTLNCPTAPQIPIPLLQSLKLHAAPTLHRISWQTGRNCALPATFFGLCPNLKTLCIKLLGAGPFGSTTEVNIDDGQHTLSNLTTLSMEGLSSDERQKILNEWKLPSLDRVSHGTSWSQALSIYVPNCCAAGPSSTATTHRTPPSPPSSSSDSASPSPSPPHVPSYYRPKPTRQKPVSLHGIRWEEEHLHPTDGSTTPSTRTWVGIRLREVLLGGMSGRGLGHGILGISHGTAGHGNGYIGGRDAENDAAADQILQARIRRFFDNLLGVGGDKAPDPHLFSHSIRVLDMGVEMVRKSDAPLFADLASWCERAGIPFVDWDHRPFRTKYHSFTGTCVLNLKGHNKTASATAA